MPLTDDEAIDAVLTPRAPVAPASAPAVTARAPSADDMAVEAALAGTSERASQNLVAAARMPPEQAAKVHKMARDAGLSAWAVEGNEVLVLHEIQTRKNRELMAKNPVLAASIANNPAFADVAFDDLENADKISKAWAAGGFTPASRVARQTADRQQQIIEQQGGGSVRRDEQPWLKPELEDAFMRGVARAGVSKTLIATELGLYGRDDADLAVQLGQELRIAARRPMSEEVAAGLAEIKEAGKGTFGEALAAVVRNPRAVLEVSAESLAASSPSLVAGVVGSMAGPVAAGAGAAMGSFAVEYASVLAEALGDTHDPQEIHAALADDKKMSAARTKAVTRGVPIAVFDGLTAGLAGRLLAGAKGTIGSVASRAAGELGMQAVGGGAGEAVAGLATNEFNWGDVLLEAFAEIPSAITEVPSNYAHYQHLRAKQAAGADGAALLSTMAQAAESLTLKRDPVAFNAFFQEVAGDSTVFVDREQLLQVFAEAKLDINEKLPSAAAQLNQATPEGIEIPIAELVTNLSGSGVEEQLVQHIRMEPNAMTIAEGNTKADEAKAFIEHTVEQIMGAKERSEQFVSEVKQIEDDVASSLNAVGAYGTGANKTNAKIMGAWYATVADKWGVTPLQIRDGWTAADGTKYAGWKPQILGAPTTAAQGPELAQPATAQTFTKAGIGNLLKADKWAILTAENPGAQELSPEQNAARNAELVKYMTEIGVEFTPVKGQYGRAENSFVVTNITPEQALNIGKKFDQESVLTRHGYVYQDGMVTPATGLTVHETPPADYFTTLPDGTTFTVDLDFERERAVSFEEANAALAQARQPKGKSVDVWSKTFREWFGKSKVVTEGGKPLVVYHGTAADVPTFDPSKAGANYPSTGGQEGFYFTDDSVIANQYAEQAGYSSLDGGENVMPVYLSLQNPVERKTSGSPDKYFDYNRDKILAAAAKAGADGVIVRGGDRTLYIAFKPEQIKSAVSNTGAFQGPNVFEQSQSTRRPTAKKAPEDHLGEVPLTVDYTKIEDDKNTQNMALVAKYPGIRFKARKAAARVEEFIQHLTSNLLWLHDQIPADIRQRSKLWYVGARAITDRWAVKYGKTDAQIAAVLAIYSPQKDWFMNVSLAERTLDIVQNQQNTTWSPEMSAVADQILADEKFAMLREAIEGKKLSELKDRLEQAVWLRTFDEAHNNRGHRLATPEGGFIEFAVSTKGVEKKTGWPGFGTIIKALYVIDDGSQKMVDRALGAEHKVRSFYNNIFHPNSDHGFVTIDTHAVAAGLLRPLSGNSTEVSHNFGGKGSAESAATGMAGTYAYYQEAYRRAAAERGLLPREMQSITWEAVRELYTMGFKHDTAKMAVVDKLWSEYEKGKRDLESVRAGILNLAGGVEQPSWVGRDSGISPEGWASTYTGELLGDSVPGRDTGTVDGRAGGRATAGTAGELYQSAEVRAGAVSGPVVGIHFSKEERPVLSSGAFGTGMPGAESERINAASDPRLKQRIAFYVNTGNGITPESGVGAVPHSAELTNLYDADADALKIWRNNRGDLSSAESAVLDAGFDGYLTRTHGKQGAAVLLGRRNLPVRPVLDPKRDQAYGAIVTAADAGPFDGGCVIAAQAIQQQIGGRLVVLTRGGAAQHAAVELNGTFYDFNGPASEAELLQRFAAAEHTPVDATRPLAPGDLPDALRSPKAAEGIAKLLPDMRTAAPYATADSVSAIAPPVPGPEIPAAKALALELANNPRLVSGQQTIEGWKKDLDRVDPETAKQIDWSKFTPGKMYYKSELADTLWQGREQWYYSALEVALKTAPAKVFGSGKAVAQWLRANAGKMGVKAAEIEATGITDWLETQGKVTQEQVVAFMAQGGVKVEEVVLGDEDPAAVAASAEAAEAVEAARGAAMASLAALIMATNARGIDAANMPHWRYDIANNTPVLADDAKRKMAALVEPAGAQAEYAQALADEREWIAASNVAQDAHVKASRSRGKFEQWQLPGGTNYRELLITLPSGDDDAALQRRYNDLVAGGMPVFEAMDATRGAPKFKSSHFPHTPNILAHVRTNERTDANGKRVLFIEEIQSDWAQKGRKEGFVVAGKLPPLWTTARDAATGKWLVLDSSDTQVGLYADTEEAAIQSATVPKGYTGGVPSAPFVTDTKSWTALGLKRIIAYAAENGFDSVAWTTGEQQSTRYDLSKQVRSVEARKLANGKYSVAADTIEGDPLFTGDVTEAELVDTIGKDLAEKIAAQEVGEYHEYTGLDLKVGGEGMTGYYDGIVPQVANDVLKKIGGGKVQQMNFYQKAGADYVMRSVATGKLIENTRFTKEEADAADPAYYKAEYSPREMDTEVEPGEFGIQPGFEITPAMREIVSTQGLPLFAGTPKKGSFSPATFELRLLADADLSTFLHEASHFFLAAYTDMAAQPGAPKALVDEVNAILAHLFKTVPGGAVAGGDLAQKVGAGATPGDIKTNPSVDRLVAMLRSSEGKSLRYVVDEDGDFHFWDAYLAVHKDGAGVAGVPYDYTRRGTVYATPDGLASFTWDIGLHTDDLRRYMVGDKTLFTAAGHGVVTGAEMAAILDAESDAMLRELLAQDGPVPAAAPLPEGQTPLEIWRQMSLDQQRPYHEAWAEQFEQYAMTGKAPSLELDSAFKTFANWLKKIYISLKGFVATHTGGKLQPDTAAFFDRMLATEEQIQTANAARSYTALFKNAADAGMSDQKFADYMALSKEQAEDAEAMLRSRSLRDMAWLQRTRTKFIAGKQAEVAELRKAVRDEISKDLAATPLRLAAKWLKHGEMAQTDGTELKVTAGNKLQISDVEALFPEGAITPRPDLSTLGYGQYGMLAKEGLAPDLVAEMFGLRSGEALVRDLLEMPLFKEEVESLTDTRMLEEHSEMLDPDAIAREADAAIHNDARTRMVATELAALNNKIGSPAALMKAARAYATQIIETKTSKTLKPWAFAAAETRAGKSALALLRKGKRDEAAEQKRVELVNHTAAKLAYQAEAELKKTIDRFKKIAGYKDDSSAIKSRDAEIVSAVRAILADFGVGTKGKTAREYLAVVQQHNPDLGAVLSDVIDSVAANAKDWREMKISELRDLAEEIEGLWFLAKRSKQIEIDGKLITLHEAQQAIYDRLDAIGIPDRVPGEGSAVTPAEKRGILFDRFVGALRRVEAWVGAKDGTLTGPFRQYMWNPIRDAADAYRADKVKYLKAYRDLLAPVAPTFTRRLIDAPEIGYVFGKDEGGMGKTELLHAILHTGNESNKRKLLLGRGWATENTDGTLDTTKWDTFVQRMHDEGVLTKADYDFAQGVWDLLESMKPLAQKAHRDVFGKYFSEVTANPFTNQFGTYVGGYVPAMADPLIVRDQDLNKLREGEEGNMAYAFPTTAKGFTKGRVEYNKPLKLDLRTLSQHIDKVLLFSHMTRPVNDVRRVMSGKAVAQALGRVDPQAYNTLIMPWLNRAAKQVVETPTVGREGLGRFWSVVRSRAGMAAMFANIANTVQQITGISLAAVRVRPALLLDSMAKYATGPKTFVEHVTSKSSYMQTRIENEVSVMSTQINETLLNPTVYESAKEWTQKHAYFMQSAMDNVISPVVWLAGYNQAIEQGLSEIDAVRAGDSAVRETQGSMAPEDIAAFETGSAFYRMFVQFAGYFNMNANLLGTEFVKLSRDMGLKKGAGRGLYVLTLGLAAPAVIGELIIQLFRGGPDDDDKDGEYLDDWLMAIFGYGPLRYVTAMVPGFGTVINAAVNTLNNKPYDDRISTAPAISMIEAAVKAPGAVYKAIVEDGKPGRAVKDVATLISMSVGLPASGLARPVSYLTDVATGHVEPTGQADLVRGTITGAASPASKQ